MKKIFLSVSQLDQVINLREKGTSWVKIEKVTGIARRIAKREYDGWVEKQSQRQLEEARKEVVAQEYRIHLNLLSRMAEFLLDSLVIPNPLTDLRGAEEIMSQFLTKDFYQDQPSFEPQLDDQQREKRINRMNELLYKSLRDHTEKKVSWQALSIWGEARNKCVKEIMKIKEGINEVFTNILMQKSELRAKIDKNNALEHIIRGILVNIWLNKVIGLKGQVTTMKGASLISRGTAWVVFHDKAPSDTNIIFNREGPGDNESLAKKVTDASKWAIENFVKSESGLIKNTKREVYVMQDAGSRLEEVLNPLVLRPIILNTKCDICPI
jgi:hypothetical protein